MVVKKKIALQKKSRVASQDFLVASLDWLHDAAQISIATDISQPKELNA
jgi:hypothetical protein